MKRWKKLVLGVLLLLLIAGAGLVWWQKENIKALKTGLQYSSEEIETKLQENQQAIKDAVDARSEVVIRDVTEEERAALKEGTLSQEELVDLLINNETVKAPPKQQTTEPTAQGSTPEEKPAELPAQTEQPEPQPTPVESEYQKALSAIIAEVYVLREQYTIELDNMFETAKAEYGAMREAKVSKEKLISWAAGYVSKASGLEKSCDRKMDDVVVRLEKLIKENHGDLSLVDTVVYTYASEKSLKKAWYMSELEKRGLI